ncbi:uncharacterized protein LOC106714351 [Papilio machaon]|uniref:uncharacterized protein LOC106714351 n=1 Tax=Papilio machaon TaxID=76193 RepID=UPI001E665F8E|nr:uncharacterized protein LOC106714351 [Papilio machaon]
MDLQKLIRERSQLRRIFNRHTATEEKFTNVAIEFLEAKFKAILSLDHKIQEILLQDVNYDEETVTKEFDDCQEIEKKWLEINFNRPGLNKQECTQIQFHIPKMDMRKFDDNPKSWIPFWTQYEKIHLDARIQNEEKFTYLLSCMAEHSKARTLVESYPPTKNNYEKVIDTLKKRFARDEVLIEIYVREILDVVLSKNNLDIVDIFDKISVNLQILESLGIGRDKYECILLPLIESSLPDDILVQWAKIPTQKGSKLQQLMTFLENEVEAQGRCDLAKFSFDNSVPKQVIPTTSCFTTKQENNVIKEKEGKVIICFFCDKGHNTLECNKADKLSLDEKKNAIKKKGGCYICLKKGHLAKYCKAFIRCMCCSKRHLVILCPTLHEQPKTCEQNSTEKHCDNNKEVYNNLSSNNITTLLQTLVVKVSTDKQEKKVRILLDSGSQRTYVKRELADDLGLQAIGTENLSHSLFSGVKKPAKKHRVFEFKVSSLDNKFHTTMTALEQDVVCGSLPKVHNPKLINNLRRQQIWLTDAEEDIKDISILIGSDQLGLIIKENFIRLDENLVAIPTKLGWTLQGPIQGDFSASVRGISRNKMVFQHSKEVFSTSCSLVGRVVRATDRANKRHVSKNITQNISGKEWQSYRYHNQVGKHDNY